MVFRMDQLLLGLSMGFDYVESEILGITTNHGKRVALLAAAMGESLGLTREERIGLATCALIHDNALTEYAAALQSGHRSPQIAALHCIKGEQTASFLPFPSDVTGFIKYHHELADLSGTFGMHPEEIPLGAQLISIADDLDIRYDLQSFSADSLSALRLSLKNNGEALYSRAAVDAMLHVFDGQLLDGLRDQHVDQLFQQKMPVWWVDQSAQELLGLSRVIAHITDYKSKFTAKHSTQIANRAYWMARYYHFDDETCAKVYIAAAFHDIGKLVTPTKILEKPGKLTPEEFAIVKKHADWSYVMLKDVEGFEEICRWAVTHHRKLNGTGYPDFPPGYVTDDFICRLMACIDIYQAVRETRPYHRRRTHPETMAILWEMAERGEIDRQITQDLDREMAQFAEGEGDVPDPFDLHLQPQKDRENKARQENAHEHHPGGDRRSPALFSMDR